MRPDPEAVARRIAEIAETTMLPRYGKLAAHEISEKSGPNDLVTEVDRETEAALKAALHDLDPRAGFVGEELAAEHPEAVAAIEGPGRFWIVDPLDGTRNFVRGEPEFGTIVAYVENGETVMGWIFAAPERAMVMAEKGGGAFRDGVRLDPAPQREAVPTGLRSTGWLTPDWRDRLVGPLRANTTSRASHCSAYAYIHLAEGAYDFKLASRIHPWDHAAGALILAEAGGAVGFLDDETPYRPRDSADRPLLIAAPGRDWRALAGLLLG